MYIYQQWFFIRVYLCMFITLKTNICKSKYMPNSEESNNLNLTSLGGSTCLIDVKL